MYRSMYVYMYVYVCIWDTSSRLERFIVISSICKTVELSSSIAKNEPNRPDSVYGMVSTIDPGARSALAKAASTYDVQSGDLSRTNAIIFAAISRS